MKQLTRQEVEAIMISFLHKKWHKVGEQKPIYIGTVLEKTSNTENDVQRNYDRLILCDLWQPLGFSRSLQEICEASGWEDTFKCGCEGSLLKNGARGIPLVHISKKHPSEKLYVLTSPEANALFSFLQEIL